MLESKSVCLFGYSGHAYVVVESLLEAGYTLQGYFDYREAKINPYCLKYLGFEKEVDIKSIVGENFVFPTVGDNEIREKLVLLFNCLELNQFFVIDQSAKVSTTAEVGLSTYVGKNVVINAQSKIGEGVILNTGCVIEHECNIENFVHIAPAAVLCGKVNIGIRSFIGSNSVVNQNISIMSDVVVGSGSVVTKNINQTGTWVGNPVKKI